MVDTRFDRESERKPAGLSMPIQAPPVYRSAVGKAGAATGGVEADGLFGLPFLPDFPTIPLPPWIPVPDLGDIVGDIFG
ncbi:hypothetical protein AB0N62_37280 [Streptomyces sp. NPDC093982]|uniref:hypothetical protein n=1 Tax=Streptomyces sp. NPDC093982 TaxID=3155077 RepID=UPI0034163323